MKTLGILPVLLVVSLLGLSTSALAAYHDTTTRNPVTGVVKSTGHAIHATGVGTVHAVGGFVRGAGHLVTDVGRGTQHVVHRAHR